MDKNTQFNRLSGLRTDIYWAIGKMRMIEHYIESDSSGGVCNEISEVIMSLENALVAAKKIQEDAKKR